MTSRTVVALIALHTIASPSPLAAQLKVDLEVTQGIQYYDPGNTTKHNSIPLVAGRRTAVRTMVEGIDPTTVIGVSGALSVAGDTKTLLPENAPDFTKFFIDNKASNHKETNGTLNFRVNSFPDTKNQGFTVTVTLTLTAGGGTKDATGTAKVDVVTVRPLEIKLVPVILVSKSGSVFGPPDRQELETDLVELVEGCFPIMVPDTQFTWQPSMTVIEDKKGCASIIDDAEKGKSEVDRTLNELHSNYNQDDSKNVIVYGLVSPTPGGGPTIGDEYCWPTLGWANCDTRSAFGTAAPAYSPKAFAHEIGHLLTLKHCDCAGEPGTCNMEGQVPFDVRTMSVVPEPYTSFMTCGGVDDKSVWATPTEYRIMINVLEDKGAGSGITFCNNGRINEPKEKRKKPGPKGKGS